MYVLLTLKKYKYKLIFIVSHTIKIEVPKFKIENIFGNKKQFKKSKKSKRTFKYTSTVRAVEFNLIGKMPKILTGFSERPLLR
jgi:hypothetical protein